MGVLEFAGDWPEPEPGPEDVLVGVSYCGFCGTDPHIIEGRFPVGPPPQVLGHEVAGEVVAVGRQVRGWSPGDRVGCNLFAYCGACPWCQAGQPQHCRRKRFSATGFAEYALYQPEQLFALPEHIAMTSAALLEPVATCLHAVELAGLRPGEHVLVIGGGPMGLILTQLARACGAATVHVSEPRARNRGVASMLGASGTSEPGATDLSEVAAGTGPRQGFDVIFEAAGVPSALAGAPDLAAACGRVVIVGVHPPDADMTIDPRLFYEKELTVRGTYATDRTFQRAIALLPALTLEPLITLVAPLEQAANAYASHKAGDQIKVLFDPGAERPAPLDTPS